MENNMSQHAALENSVYEMTPAEFFAVFDRAARKLLGLSGDEFIARWESGGFGSDPDSVPGVMEVAALMPSATA
jgi:hypothetical protein